MSSDTSRQLYLTTTGFPRTFYLILFMTAFLFHISSCAIIVYIRRDYLLNNENIATDEDRANPNYTDACMSGD
jgi:uncharacterized membrane protein YdbT with pleckstrin-like domain